MSKSISFSVLFICNLIVLASFINMNFFSDAMPIGNNQYLNNGISDLHSSCGHNNYSPVFDYRLLQSMSDEYNSDYRDISVTYPIKEEKILPQTGQTQSFIQEPVAFCAKEIVQLLQNSVREENATRYIDQHFFTNLTDGVNALNTYFVWGDTATNFDILFRSNSTSPTKNLSNNTGRSDFPQISSSGTNVYVVWQDNTPGNSDIFFAASTDGGQTFSPEKNLSTNPGHSSSPQISSSGENVYVVWQDITPGNSDIFFAASTDGGQIFSPARNLSTNPGDSTLPQISSSSNGNNVYVVWQDNTPGKSDIFFAESTDSGQTYSTKNLSTNPGESSSSQISSTLEGSNVYVVWQDFTPGNYDIFFAASTDGGQTFSPAKNLSANANRSEFPQISQSSDGTNVYVVWQDFTPGNSDIFLTASTDGGQTFIPVKNLSPNTGKSAFPQISSSSNGNNVFVVWQDFTPGNSDIFLTASTDGGQTFSPAKNLSTNPTSSEFPQVTSSLGGTDVYVVWGDNDILIAVSTNGGQTFEAVERLSANTGFSQDPQVSSSQIFTNTFSTAINLSTNPGGSTAQKISSSGNNVYVVWLDKTPGNYDVFFRASTDGGQTFSPTKNLSTSPGDFFTLPQISSSGNNVYVVWGDIVAGNFDIFFTASTDGGQTFSPVKNLSNNGKSAGPQISSSGDNVYVMWGGNVAGNVDIFFTASTDGGQTFNPPKNLSTNPGDSTSPQISSSGDNVYVVWRDGTTFNADVLFAASTDRGQTFNPLKNLSNNPVVSNFPLISSSRNNVYVVWQSIVASKNDVLFTASTDRGQTFSTTKNLSNTPGESGTGSISGSGNNVYVLWRDNTPGSSNVFFTASMDRGQTFSTKNLSNNPGGSGVGPMSSIGNNVYVVWQDNNPSNSEIFFTASTDGGQTFSSAKNLSVSPGTTSDPIISTSSWGTNVYVVWKDFTPGNYDIFFTSSTNIN